MSDPYRVMAEKMVGISPETAAPDLLAPDGQLEMRPRADDHPRAPIDEAAKALAMTIAEAADDRKAGDITILQTGDVSYLADYFVIATGFSRVQVRAIANSISTMVADQLGRQPLRTEGMSEGRWVLQDYGEVIAHVFMPDDREFYDLEAFWGHAERVEFVPAPPVSLANPSSSHPNSSDPDSPHLNSY